MSIDKIKAIKEVIKTERESLSRSVVATPETRQRLEEFADANHGSMDQLLMQMAIQFGYTIALEKIEESLNDDPDIEENLRVADEEELYELRMQMEEMECRKKDLEKRLNY